MATPVRKEKREKEKGRCILVTSVAQEKGKKKKISKKRENEKKHMK